MYMVPPFLAYYGITTSNESMLREAYNQVRYPYLSFNEESHRSLTTRLNCTATTSATRLLAGSGNTLSLAKMAQIQDTGRQVRNGTALARQMIQCR